MSIASILADSILFLEVICAIAASIFFKKYREGELRYLLPYFWFVVAVELVGLYLRRNGINNSWVYNVFDYIQYPFFFYIYHRHFTSAKFKKMVVYLTIVFFLMSAINWILFQPTFMEYHNRVFTMGSVLLSIVIVVYFMEILNTDRILNITEHLIVWVSFGLLFFHLTTIPLYAVINSLSSITDSVEQFMALQNIPNIVMYLSFILGFICSKPQKT